MPRARHRVSTDIGRLLCVIAAGLIICGCHDASRPAAPGDEHAPPPGFALSDPSELAAAVSPSADGDAVAYVSVAPGTLTDAVTVRIRNITAGEATGMLVTLREGGFDPVSISARPGDRLELRIARVGGAITTVTFVVPARRPPVVVRTNPPKGRTDVALSIRPLIVFSEPIDPQSVGPGSVRLLRDGAPVSGTVEVVAGSPFMVVFNPDAPLDSLAQYELAVALTLRDLQGDALQQELRVGFTTGDSSTSVTWVVGPILRVSNLTTGGAYDVDGYQVIVRNAGQTIFAAPLELNTTLDVRGLSGDDLSVELADVATNCAVSGGPSRGVRLPSPPALFTLAFDVTCTPSPELASINLIFSRSDGIVSAHIVTMAADGGNVRQLTSGPVLDVQPIISPDGSRVAFSRSTDGKSWWGQFHVHLMNASGGNTTQLTHQPRDHPPVTDFVQDWSPDGTRLALVSDYGTIVLVDADGTDRKVLVDLTTFGTSHTEGAYFPAWSPDGRTIAFSRYSGPAGQRTCDDPSRAYEVWSIGVDGANLQRLRRLTRCQHAGPLFWSSDGSRILYHDGAVDGAPGLWSMSADGSNAVELLPPNRFGAPFGPLSPDGTHLVFTRQMDDGTDIYLVRLADGHLVRVTADGRSDAARFLP